jgi:glycine cleavage system H protein
MCARLRLRAMDVPGELRYTNDHEWVRVTEDGVVRLGVTDYAQDALGDVVFVELPDIGAGLSSGAVCGEIESTKSVSEVYSPLDGAVTSVNSAIVDDPSLINSDPYGEGWILEIRLNDPASVDALLSADDYRSLTEG